MAALDSDKTGALGQENEHRGLTLAQSPDPSQHASPSEDASDCLLIPHLPLLNSPTGPRLLSGFRSALSGHEGRLSIDPGEDERGTDHRAGDAASAHQHRKGEPSKDTTQQPVAANLALRFTNRPNGTPLTTIIEQRSYSTLDSRPSLISIPRRYTSGQLELSHSSSCLSPNTRDHEAANRRRASRSLDEVALHKASEAARQKRSETGNIAIDKTVTSSPAQSNIDAPRTTPLAHNETPVQSPCPSLPSPVSSPATPSQPLISEPESRPVRNALRTLLDTVRKGPRQTLSLTSLQNCPNAYSATSRFTRWRGGSEPSPEGHSSEQAHRRKRAVHEPNVTGSIHTGYNLMSGRSAALLRRDAAVKHPNTSPQPANASVHKTPTVLLKRHVYENQAITSTTATPIALKPDPLSSSPTSTPSLSQFPSPPVNPPTISSSRFLNPHRSPPTVLSLSHGSRDDDGALYSYDGVLIYRPNAPSLHKYDRSRTTSCVSSLSNTSSMLETGEDHHNGSIGRKDKATAKARHDSAIQDSTNTTSDPNSGLGSRDGSQNTPTTTTDTEYSINIATPLAFYTPTTWLASKNAPPTISPNTTSPDTQPNTRIRTHIKTHTLTSAALPILLPFAAANNIIETSTVYKPAKPSSSSPNHSNTTSPPTCVTSFHSPSGNLIRISEADNSDDDAPEGLMNFVPREPLARPVRLPAMKVPPATYPLPKWLRKAPGAPGEYRYAYRPLSTGSTGTQQGQVKLPLRTSVHPSPRAVVRSVEGGEKENRSGNNAGNGPRFVGMKEPVQGCGGEVRAASLQPRSGIKAGFQNKAKGMEKRVSIAGVDGAVDTEVQKNGPVVRFQERVAERAGWGMRVCFCQPKDEEGNTVHVSSRDSK